MNLRSRQSDAHKGQRRLGLVLLTGLACAVLVSPALAARVHPGLERAFAAEPTTPQAVWVTFADKGERDASELAAMLAEAEASLTPRARARRLRATVTPLVDYRDLAVNPTYINALRSRGALPYGVSRWFNQVAVHIDARVARDLSALSFVGELRPVERAARSALLPYDESLATPFPARPLGVSSTLVDYGSATAQVAQIGVPAVHDSGYIGTGVLVAVLDSGFDGHETHEALASLNVAAGHKRDFVEGDSIVTGHFHGTLVLGCIAGNLPGTYVGSAYGAAFALARTEDVRTETRQEMVYWQMGAEWADSLGADLLTSSLGYYTFDDSLEDYTPDSLDGQTTISARAAQIAASKGILIVNSAGNNGTGPPEWNGKLVTPADVHGDSLIAVGAVDGSGVRASFSSMGPTADGRIKPDLMAWGSAAWVISSSNPSVYFQASGTSFSAPLLAGLAACILQARPSWTPVQVIQALRESGDRFANPDTLYGYGIPNGLITLQWPSTVGVALPILGQSQIALLGPNPLRSDGPDTRVRFALHADAGASAVARVRVYDAQGRVVRRLWEGTLVPGQWVTVAWDGRRDSGDRQAGLFFITLEESGRRHTARVVSLP